MWRGPEAAARGLQAEGPAWSFPPPALPSTLRGCRARPGSPQQAAGAALRPGSPEGPGVGGRELGGERGCGERGAEGGAPSGWEGWGARRSEGVGRERARGRPGKEVKKINFFFFFFLKGWRRVC